MVVSVQLTTRSHALLILFALLSRREEETLPVFGNVSGGRVSGILFNSISSSA